MNLPRITPGPLAAAVLALLITLTGCGFAGDSEDAGATDDTSAGADDQAWPRTVTNCGREVTIEAQPTRIVGFEGAAETVFALGAGDQMAGYFGSERAALPEDLATEAAEAEHLGGSFPTPKLEALIEPDPDLIVLYGYNQEAGITQEALDKLGVPHLILSEQCPESPDNTVEGYFEDAETFATAIGADEAGKTVVGGWRTEIEKATATPVEGEPTVFIMGSPDPKSPFASGGASLADEQITLAGGSNLFGDTDEAFLEPSWEEIADRNPDVIVDGSGGKDESMAALKKYLKGDAALSGITAVKDDRFLVLDYYDNVPGPRVVDGVVKLAEFLRG
ncbi:ABC transporter substrate-binding protein [Nocardioides speluncae]|uniref:ABC transporter substrate-binding protein n=1 Tax=Nocardioides speluncae TaxID=2670337 RepID=UPI00137B8EC2|nr:ABC transporter substrate-binding protein [Nocardioides speluncae]